MIGVLDLRSHVRPGDGVWWGQAAAEATPLVDALHEQLADIGAVRAFCGIAPHRRTPPDGLTVVSYGAMGQLRALRERLEVVPGHYSTLPRLFAQRLLPGDVGLVQVAPPGPDGTCSLGIGVDYSADAARHSRTLVAEVNHRMPVTRGEPGIPFDRFAAVLETDRPLPALPDRAPDEVDAAIAAHVADLVEDGDTVQIGVGALPNAILAGLAGHRDLGVHTGMITDGVLRLVEAGVVTGSRKEIDPGVVVTGMALCSPGLYASLPDLPVEFRPAGYTHGAAVLARLGRLVSVNAALQVDLTGQVGSETVGGRYLGGVGGQADFSGAAARTGARSIIALRSCAGESSTVVTALDGPVTTARADVDVVVTEHGVAHLRGCPLPDRPRRLAAIADPRHRDALLRAASSKGLR